MSSLPRLATCAHCGRTYRPGAGREALCADCLAPRRFKGGDMPADEALRLAERAWRDGYDRGWRARGEGQPHVFEEDAA
jgi:hypothetical protein